MPWRQKSALTAHPNRDKDRSDLLLYTEDSRKTNASCNAAYRLLSPERSKLFRQTLKVPLIHHPTIISILVVRLVLPCSLNICSVLSTIDILVVHPLHELVNTES